MEREVLAIRIFRDPDRKGPVIEPLHRALCMLVYCYCVVSIVIASRM